MCIYLRSDEFINVLIPNSFLSAQDETRRDKSNGWQHAVAALIAVRVCCQHNLCHLCADAMVSETCF